MQKLLFCLLFLSVLQIAQAQDADTLVVDKKTSKLIFDVNYLSDNVYQGRKDSVRLPYITPSINYVHKSGFYADANVSYLTKESRVDLATIGAGFEFGSKGWENEISVEKYFYSGESFNVASNISASLGVSSSYDFGFIQPSLSGYASFANKTDYSFTAGLEHSFYALKEQLTFTPAVYANASTQNYYQSYSSNKRFGAGRRARTVEITAQLVDADKFKILDYELMATVEYAVKNFSFYFIPVLAIPTNANTVIVTTKPPNMPAMAKSNTEKLENQFFWTLGVSYDLSLKKH